MTSNEQSSPLKSSPMEVVTGPINSNHGTVEVAKDAGTMTGEQHGLGLDVGFQAVPMQYMSMRW